MFIERFFSSSRQVDSSVYPSQEIGEVRSEHSLWDATKIAKRYSQLPSFRQSLTGALTEDMRHLCREDLLQEKHISWTEDISDRGIEGNGYDEVMMQMTQNYIAYCTKEFGDASRAIMEHQVQTEIEGWAMKTADQPGNFLVWLSPPGKEYGGVTSLAKPNQAEKFPTKLNLKWSEVQKDATTGQKKILIHTVQLTGWPTLDQLVDVWEDLNQRSLPNQNRADLITDLIGNLTYLHDPRFTPEKMLDHVSQSFFRTQASWEHAQEMPTIKPDFFWQYETGLWQDFYLPKATRLFAGIPNDLPDQDPYWQSPEYQQIINQLDLLFHFFYRHLQNEIGRPTNQAFQPNQLKSRLQILNQEFATELAIRTGQRKLNDRQQADHQQMLASVLNLTNRTLSVTQCGVLAPFTAPISAMKTMSGMNGLAFAVPLPEGRTEQLRSPLYQQKLAEYQRIQAGDYQEVTLKVNGELVSYMVPASFLEGKGCFLTMIDGQEVAMGPCDVPLDTKFADPAENLVYQMSTLEFANYRQQLKQFLFTQETTVAEDLIEENLALSPKEKRLAKELLEQLRTKIFSPMIGLSELVSGVTPFALDAGLYMPGNFLQQLQGALNPLKFLEELLETAEASEFFSATVFSTTMAL